MCNAHTVDVDTGEQFAQVMLSALNGGSLAVMISIGHQTGLFEALAEVQHATSHELAARAGLNERYVREWLGALVCARVVEVDATSTQYSLPPAHRPFLTKQGGSDNMAGFTQYVAMFGRVEQGILNCFRRGGGLDYDAFERFHDIMAEDSGQSVLTSLFDHILPLADGLVDRLQAGIDVLDLGCGRGLALLEMAERYPRSRFTGYDLCEAPIAEATEAARQKALSNVRFEQLDAEKLALADSFDFIATFDAIHDQARPDVVLRNIHTALRPNGCYLMQDIDASSHVRDNIEHPLGTFLYTISTMHCMTVSLARGGLGLGTMWGRQQALKMLHAAGFSRITEHVLPHDQQNRYYVLNK